MVREFLALELPGLAFATIDLTRRRRGMTLDFVFNLSSPGAMAAVPVQAFALARGLGPGDERDFLEALSREAEAIKTVESKPEGGVWFGTLQFRAPALPDPRAVAVLGFAAKAGLGIGWIRIEQGVTFIRAEIGPGFQPRRVLADCQAFLRERRIDADVDLETASSRDAGPWMELLLRTLDRNRSAGSRPRE